jgi:TatD DNase family protein
VKRYFEKRRFVAVGETGLDFYWDRTFTKEQYESFQTQIELAKQYDIPVVIHSRNSIDECIKGDQGKPARKFERGFSLFFRK